MLDPGFDLSPDEMPTEPEWEATIDVPLFEWLQSKFFDFDSVYPYRKVTWEKLVVEYGNAYGSHLGVSHPAEITQARLFGAHGRSLMEHGLWLAACVALNSLAELLPQIGEPPPRRRRLEHPVASIGGLAAHLSQRGSWFTFAMSYGYALGGIELLRAPFEGKVLTIRAERVRQRSGEVLNSAHGTYK